MISELIKEQLRWQTSRIDIDRNLLEMGHAPADIEMAWQQVLYPAPPQKSSFGWFNEDTCTNWPLTPVLLVWMCMLGLGDSLFSNYKGLLSALSPVMFIIVYLIISRQIRLLQGGTWSKLTLPQIIKHGFLIMVLPVLFFLLVIVTSPWMLLIIVPVIVLIWIIMGLITVTRTVRMLFSRP